MTFMSFVEKIYLINSVYEFAVVKINELSHTQKKMMSHSLEDTIFYCSFNRKFGSLQDDFIWYFDPFFGNCWDFNSIKKKDSFKYSTSPGILNGLSLT